MKYTYNLKLLIIEQVKRGAIFNFKPSALNLLVCSYSHKRSGFHEIRYGGTLHKGQSTYVKGYGEHVLKVGSCSSLLF